MIITIIVSFAKKSLRMLNSRIPMVSHDDGNKLLGQKGVFIAHIY